MIANPENGCICEGNWRNIVHQYEYLFGRLFKDPSGNVFRFTGLVHADDDYYYLLLSIKTGRPELLSCVGNLETWGYTLVAPTATIQPALRAPEPCDRCSECSERDIHCKGTDPLCVLDSGHIGDCSPVRRDANGSATVKPALARLCGLYVLFWNGGGHCVLDAGHRELCKAVR